ncbi:MAG TPA: poly-beta-1,6-N-acetyl-D-glucosamine biosynthesis protein PgaD [Alphaproteobacteria bacterium]|nr:poly-beta-1,6-N-acetyl-D-glucosamine biosynthesis protein PgaD [Alphaproteobacteria bacterium]
MSPDRHIIDRSRDIPILIRVRDVLLTIFVWLLYLYLLRDFFTFTGDAIRWTFNGFDNAERYTSLRIISTIVSYFEVILIMEFLYIGWSFYNLLRFGKKSRRRTPPSVTPDEIAKLYSASLKDVNQWQGATTMVMHHDKEGHLLKVVTS